MTDIIAPGKNWEFGSQPWVQYAANLGVSIIGQSDLDLTKYEWGFSEEYTNIPERLLAGREKAGYHLMIHNGQISGGPTLPDECLALPGFHVAVDWALIAHSSYFPFNIEGRVQRAADHATLRADLTAANVPHTWIGPTPVTKKTTTEETKATTAQELPACPACKSTDHKRQDCPIWPPGIGEVLAENKDKTNRLIRSPELEGLPETTWGVPIFSAMTPEQRTRFTQLLS
jgi:hypothetical protein